MAGQILAVAQFSYKGAQPVLAVIGFKPASIEEVAPASSMLVPISRSLVPCHHFQDFAGLRFTRQ